MYNTMALMLSTLWFEPCSCLSEHWSDFCVYYDLSSFLPPLSQMPVLANVILDHVY